MEDRTSDRTFEPFVAVVFVNEDIICNTACQPSVSTQRPQHKYRRYIAYFFGSHAAVLGPAHT